MLIREVLLFSGLEVRTELLLDSAAARGTCRREGVGTIRHLSTKVLWGETRSGHGLSVFIRREPPRLLGTKPLPAHRPQQLRHWNGLALDRNERLATGDKEDGQDENGEQEAAVRSWAERRSFSGHRWSVQYGKWLIRSLGNISRESVERGSVRTGQGFSHESHRCVSGRLVHDCWHWFSCTQALCCDRHEGGYDGLL